LAACTVPNNTATIRSHFMKRGLQSDRRPPECAEDSAHYSERLRA
jgi:hypothetical protein